MLILRQPRFLRNTSILAGVLLVLGLLHYTYTLSNDRSFPLFDDSPFKPPSPPGSGRPATAAEWEQRADQVKEAFRRSYAAYEKYAFPYDELKPLTKTAWASRFNGWGVSTIDSLDTMHIMGLKDELERGLALVKKLEFPMFKSDYAPYFETVIRYLGGFLSAYTLTNDKIYLDKAEQLAILLDPVFNTTSGLPTYGVNTLTPFFDSGNITPRFSACLAEIGTLQIEYTYLAKLTGEKRWYDRVKQVTEIFANADLRNTGGMLPTTWSLDSGRPASDGHLSLGGTADSGHEYLLKQYLLTGKTDKTYLELYLRAATQSIAQLLYISPTRNIVYATDASGFSDMNPHGYVSHKFEHLTCFFPGLLALGAHTLPLNDLKSVGIDFKSLGDNYGAAKQAYETLSRYNLKDVHLWAAEAVGQACYLLYADQPTGLSPDEVFMKTPPDNKSTRWLTALEGWRASGARGSPPGTGNIPPVSQEDVGPGDYNVAHHEYVLRPETVESFYILYKVTGKSIWRERGWEVFQALERSARTDEAYAKVSRVGTFPPAHGDELPSYFFAETLKYLYLLFKDDDSFDLDKWVFNTEAHPFKTFEWTEEERRRFEI
ncbi:glycoside hydrolase [Pterulicium gracile]|uniref:alpha-1,2-Mannosidase n=1 Tax=Pterulicium gracile TaxID=1884261 RepID=A0A5C3QNU0_9AGAR|nr:glycoside hydrolase [Pterula gracilis]